MIREHLNEKARIWGPRVAFFAVFGFTGLACVGAVKAYRAIRGIKDADMVITEDDWKNGQA